MKIDTGDIYGFIGSNGAGKSTLMKIIAGHCLASSGYFELLGVPNNQSLDKSRQKLGCIINSPSILLNYTAQENLFYQNILTKTKDKELVKNTLKLVGLEKEANKKAAKFSLGMKQRLGLGIALISNPEFIILDEPINGLDPQGIAEFRYTLSSLSKNHNKTILISSHILSELQLIATKYGFIRNGNLIKEVTLNQLENEINTTLLIDTHDNLNTIKLLKDKYKLSNKQIVIRLGKIEITNINDSSDSINYFLVKNDIRVKEITYIKLSLENYYKSIVEE